MTPLAITADYRAQVSQCIHCGLCLSSCPTYNVLGAEMNAPRGRIAMLRAISAGRFPLSASVSRYTFSCIGCQACRVACPSGVRTDEIFLGGKRIIAGSEFFPTPLTELEQRVRVTHNISGEPSVNRLLWMENIDDKPQAARPASVALFTGCVAALYPMVYGILQSTVRLLQKAEIDFTILGADEWCCGFPLLAAGLDASELMEHNLERLKALGAETLVTSCPSCYHTWKFDYAASSLRVLHATEYLAELVDGGRLPLQPLARRVTYHDPCDLGRKSKVYDAPRKLINSIPGVEYVELKSNRDNSLCCGGGGNLESLDTDLSRGVAKLRLEQIVASQAQTVTSACQQCERTLMMAARRERAKVKVMDIVQLLDESVNSKQ